jgi:cysteinyl-tRNA synthetase
MVETSEVALYNTRLRSTETLVPLKPNAIGMYACGPTVYSSPHIGNMRTYIFEDLLQRTLRASGYEVKHVLNITDVGHLQSDADEGRDKMEVAAAREQRSPWDIARAYEEVFFRHCELLNITRPDVVCRATEHIPEMLEFIEAILANGFGYVSDGNAYFDTSRFEAYREFARLPDDDAAAVNRVESDARKRSPRDFVLWFSQSKFPNQIMKWDSPWGTGFPGWHIECSAMASKYLGERFDIHCGGVDHIPVHHTNEIAQSESRFGHSWVNCWVHGEFLTVGEDKVSKSADTKLTVDLLRERGYDPLDYRYLTLTAHYRARLGFSWDALSAAREARQNLKRRVQELSQARAGALGPSDAESAERYRSEFRRSLANDLNAPGALAASWKLVKDESLHPARRQTLLAEFDRILAVGLTSANRALTAEQDQLIQEREQARLGRDWARADELRRLLQQQGVEVKDGPEGPVWSTE